MNLFVRIRPTKLRKGNLFAGKLGVNIKAPEQNQAGGGCHTQTFLHRGDFPPWFYTHLAFVPSPIIYLSGAWNGSQSLICCQRLPGAPNPNWFPLFYLEICIAAIMDQFPSAAANARCVPTVLFFPTKNWDDMFFFHHYGQRIHFCFISAPPRGCVSSVCQNSGDYLDLSRSHTACCTQQEKL